MLERAPRVGGLGQVELIVSGYKVRLSIEGSAGHLQTQVVVQEVGCRLLERVEGRHHEPYLVEPRLVEYLFRKLYVTRVNGVEAAAEDTDFGLRFEI